jgi:hypothetical protein
MSETTHTHTHERRVGCNLSIPTTQSVPSRPCKMHRTYTPHLAKREYPTGGEDERRRRLKPTTRHQWLNHAFHHDAARPNERRPCHREKRCCPALYLLAGKNHSNGCCSGCGVAHNPVGLGGLGGAHCMLSLSLHVYIYITLYHSYSLSPGVAARPFWPPLIESFISRLKTHKHLSHGLDLGLVFYSWH